jgi:hypothetical protein
LVNFRELATARAHPERRAARPGFLLGAPDEVVAEGLGEVAGRDMGGDVARPARAAARQPPRYGHRAMKLKDSARLSGRGGLCAPAPVNFVASLRAKG